MKRDGKGQTGTLWSLRVFIKKKTDGSSDRLDKAKNSNYMSIYNMNRD